MRALLIFNRSPEPQWLLNDGLQTLHGLFQQQPYPVDSYFELRFQEEVYHVRNSQTSYIGTLSKSPYFEEGVLTIPANFNRDDFEIFTQFLLAKNHTPGLTLTLQKTATNTQAMSLLASQAKCGPPYILIPNLVSPPFLLNTVAAYNLAKCLGFEPMVMNALHRLDSLPFTLEDPILVLEHIYIPQSLVTPGSDIRDWVVRWLSVQLLNTFGEHATTYMTNLGVLERHPDCASRFRRLKEKSNLLAADVSYVQRRYPVSRGPQEFRATTLQSNSWSQPGYASSDESTVSPTLASIPSWLSHGAPWNYEANLPWTSLPTDDAVSQQGFPEGDLEERLARMGFGHH